MPSEFEVATAVSRQGTGRYQGEILDGWDIGGNANGGYVLAIAARAMAAEVGRPPLTVTAHYLAPAPPGPCEVDVEVHRSGRRTATVGAALRQGDRTLIQVLGTFADPAPSGVDLRDGAPPELPPFESCTRSTTADPGFVPPIQDRLDSRLRPGDAAFRVGEPTGRAEMAGWFALGDHGPIDALGLLLASDAFPPAVFNSGLPVAWVPTLELTVHVRAVPVEGPLACVFRTRFAADGLLEEDGELWDGAGRLVALSRQLALMPRG
ncbi:MAG: thioesterase family protein [Ilumatobacteraceae bacterium]|nr:thioesterase family protein [Ilumatobacteraceae bacterium]